MAGGAGAGADGGAGGGGGGDGRGPSGGSSSSGGRNLRGECPSVSLRLGAEAVPSASRGVPARKGLCLGGGGAGLGLGRRGGRQAAGGERAVVGLGLRRRRRTDRCPCALRGRLGCAPSSRGQRREVWRSGRGEQPEVAATAAWPAPGSKGRDPPLPGRRETAPETRTRFTRLRGCDRPGVGVRAAGRNRGGNRPADGCARGGEKLDRPGKLLFRDQTGIAF